MTSLAQSRVDDGVERQPKRLRVEFASSTATATASATAADSLRWRRAPTIPPQEKAGLPISPLPQNRKRTFDDMSGRPGKSVAFKEPLASPPSSRSAGGRPLNGRMAPRRLTPVLKKGPVPGDVTVWAKNAFDRDQYFCQCMNGADIIQGELAALAGLFDGRDGAGSLAHLSRGDLLRHALQLKALWARPPENRVIVGLNHVGTYFDKLAQHLGRSEARTANTIFYETGRAFAVQMRLLEDSQSVQLTEMRYDRASAALPPVVRTWQIAALKGLSWSACFEANAALSPAGTHLEENACVAAIPLEAIEFSASDVESLLGHPSCEAVAELSLTHDIPQAIQLLAGELDEDASGLGQSHNWVPPGSAIYLAAQRGNGRALIALAELLAVDGSGHSVVRSLLAGKSKDGFYAVDAAVEHRNAHFLLAFEAALKILRVPESEQPGRLLLHRRASLAERLWTLLRDAQSELMETGDWPDYASDSD